MSILADDGTFNKQFLNDQLSSFLKERVSTTISPDVKYLLKKAYAEETTDSAKEMVKTLLRNVEMAEKQKKTGLPISRFSYSVHQVWEMCEYRRVDRCTEASYIKHYQRRVFKTQHGTSSYPKKHW